MKKRLLLHCCCGPCSTSVIERLQDEYEVAAFFYNPNIFPIKEYGDRLKTEKYFCEKIGIKLIEGKYEHEKWLKDVDGLEKEPEGGKRCEICFEMRIRETAKKAKELNYNIFAMTLSVSPHKNYTLVSKLGNEIAKESGVEFLDMDFKKKDGFKRSMELSKEHDLYRQNYCGCEYSKRDA